MSYILLPFTPSEIMTTALFIPGTSNTLKRSSGVGRSMTSNVSFASTKTSSIIVTLAHRE